MAKGWGEIPCPEPLAYCQYDPPFADDHHVYWPKPEFRTPLETKFRNLDVNIIRGLCRCLHDMEHLKQPPQKPSRQVMREAIDNA